jgi:hypothetical protein
MTACETDEHFIRHRPELPDRPDWLGGEALVSLHAAPLRPNILRRLLSPRTLFAFLVGAVIGSSATLLILSARKHE